MTSFTAIAAATGEPLPGTFAEATPASIDAAARSAADAFGSLSSLADARRGELLSRIAAGMRDRRDEICQRCETETGYLPGRVAGEFDRAAGQLELFAQLATDRVWDVRHIDPADPNRPLSPRPELRRRMVPVGPVAVFGACNFPLAISVVGNDTVAALASGCPVIVKSHPGHPGTCELLGRVVTNVVAEMELHPGVFALLHGRDPATSIALVTHDAIAAVGFTGSPAGGRAIAQAALRRTRPIPVFAELGSTNPVFITPAALAARCDAIADGFAASLTFGNGQMCTKPGIVVVCGDSSGPWETSVADRFARHVPLPLVGPTVAAGFDQGIEMLRGLAEIDWLVGPSVDSTGPFHRPVHWAAIDADVVLANDKWLHLETFGPVSTLVRCRDESQMQEIASRFRGSLTTTLHAESSDAAFMRAWLDAALRYGGRLIHNGWPTGMEIGPATHHGGPFPASLDGRSTSVGHASLERFVRPVCLQNWPVGVVS